MILFCGARFFLLSLSAFVLKNREGNSENIREDFFGGFVNKSPAEGKTASKSKSKSSRHPEQDKVGRGQLRRLLLFSDIGEKKKQEKKRNLNFVFLGEREAFSAEVAHSPGSKLKYLALSCGNWRGNPSTNAVHLP